MFEICKIPGEIVCFNIADRDFFLVKKSNKKINKKGFYIVLMIETQGVIHLVPI